MLLQLPLYEQECNTMTEFLWASILCWSSLKAILPWILSFGVPFAVFFGVPFEVLFKIKLI
jgi:hypothetical protein